MIIENFLSPTTAATSFLPPPEDPPEPPELEPGVVDENDIELLKLFAILEAIADAPNVLQAKPLYHPGEYGFSSDHILGN